MYPADGVLNLPRRNIRMACGDWPWLSRLCGSFEQAGQAIQRATSGRVGKHQVQQLARSAAVDVDGFYAALMPEPSLDGDVVMLALDGMAIVMRPGALRKATGWAAASKMHELTTRFSRGEKHTRKRMAEVGSVDDVTPALRAVADIIHTPSDGPRSGNRGPYAHGKWLPVSIINDVPAVISTTLDEASRHGPEHTRTWIK